MAASVLHPIIAILAGGTQLATKVHLYICTTGWKAGNQRPVSLTDSDLKRFSKTLK